MVYRGHVRNGVVVLDDPAVRLPDGAEVQIAVVAPADESVAADKGDATLGQKLLRYAGKAIGLPSDAARNHDHYLYGTPKQ